MSSLRHQEPGPAPRQESSLSTDRRMGSGVTTTRDRCKHLWSKAKTLISKPENIQPRQEYRSPPPEYDQLEPAYYQPGPEHNQPMDSHTGNVHPSDRPIFGDVNWHGANHIENSSSLQNSTELANTRLNDRASSSPSAAAASNHHLKDNVEVRDPVPFNNVMSRQNARREPVTEHRVHEAELNAAELKHLGLAPHSSARILTAEERAHMAARIFQASHGYPFDEDVGVPVALDPDNDDISYALFPDLRRRRALARYMGKFRLRFYKNESHASAASVSPPGVSPRNSLGHAGSIASRHEFVGHDTRHRDHVADAEDDVNCNDSFVNDRDAEDVGEDIVADAPQETNPHQEPKGKEPANPFPCDMDLSRMDEHDLVRLLDDIDQASHSRQDSGVGGAASDWNFRVKGKGKATDYATPGQRPNHSKAQDQHIYAGFKRLTERIYRRLEEISEARAHIPEKPTFSHPSLGARHTTPFHPNTPHPARKNPPLECQVCGDAKPYLDFPLLPPTFTCTHAPNTCTTCTQTWLASELASKGPTSLKCPECPAILSHTDVRSSASPATFAKYDALAARQAMAAEENFAWCRGAGCASGQYWGEGSGFMRCAECRLEQCVRHGAPWHRGESCGEFEYRTGGLRVLEERASRAVVEAISKACPGKRCGMRIEKAKGCDHMTCRRCRHEFCWQCLAPQQEIRRVGNTAHAKSCKFHSDNLKVAWPFNAH